MTEDRLRTAIELLESLVADRNPARQSPPRKIASACSKPPGRVSRPDAPMRRHVAKTARRGASPGRDAAAESVLAEHRYPEGSGARSCSRPRTCSSRRVHPGDEVAGRAGGQTGRRRRRSSPKHCYVCKEHYTTLHHFYDQLCPPCAALNFAKRHRARRSPRPGRAADRRPREDRLPGRHQAPALRARALIVTTRFPRDSAARYARESDFADWGDRLEIFGLDLRHTPSVEAFCRQLLATRDRPRLHRQQRLSDRPPAARLLSRT